MDYSNIVNNTFLMGIIAGIVSIIILNIDSRINNNKPDSNTYVKLFLLTMIIVIIMHNLTLTYSNKGLMGGGDLDINIDDPTF